MYKLNLTEEEIAIIMQALSHYQFDNPFTTEEQYQIAQNVINKIDKIL